MRSTEIVPDGARTTDGATPARSVLAVVKGLGLGGAERALLNVATALRDEGWAVTVVNVDPSRASMHGQYERAGIRVVDLPGAGWRAAFAPVALRRAMRAASADVVFAHLPIAGVIARLAALGTGVPVVYVEHSVVDRYRRATRWLNRGTYGLNTRVVAVSRAVAESISRAYGATVPVEIVPNGVALPEPASIDAARSRTRRALGAGPDEVVIGTVASLRPVKRIDLLIDAFRGLREAGRATRLVVAGDGPERIALERDAGPGVAFLGSQPRSLECLAALDVYVLCSAWEGLPLALLEAMAAGRAVVATRVGGVPEVLVDGVNGLLVEPGDAEALARAIDRLASDAALRRRLGEAARDTIRAQWSLALNVGRIRSVLSDARSRPSRA